MTDYTRIEVNVQTGEQTIVPLTPEEIAEIESRPPPPPVVPQEISDRQFFQQAAILNLITQQEALAAVKTGDVPALLQNIVDTIPDANQKFAAQMLLSGATVFQRNHPLVDNIGIALSWTSEQIDQFFIAAAQL